MNTVATKCEVVKINIDLKAWKAQAKIADSDPHAEAVSFCSAEDCTLLFLTPAVFDTGSLFLKGGTPKELDVVAKGESTEIKVVVASTITTVPPAEPQVHVCGGPRIIVP